MPCAVGLQRLERACRGKIKGSIVLLERAQTFAQFASQLQKPALPSAAMTLILGLRFLLPPRDGLLVPRVDGLQGNDVFAPDSINLRHHHGLEPESFADFDTQFLCHSLVWIMAHHTPSSRGRLLPARRLKKGDSVSLTSRALSRELSKMGSPVLLTKLARRMTSVLVSAGRAKKTRHVTRAATMMMAAAPAEKHKSAIVSSFRRRSHGENWRERLFDGGQWQVAIFDLER